jgi:hypothetical protein
VGLLFLDTSP